jgi:hypothetical protein
LLAHERKLDRDADNLNVFEIFDQYFDDVRDVKVALQEVNRWLLSHNFEA